MGDHVERIRARIGKMTYQLTAVDDPQKMRDIAATADAMMEQVASRQPQLNQISQAVLALVNAVGMMEEAHTRTREAYDARDLSERTAEETRAELTRLREQFWQLKKELLYYRNLCEIYETKLSERMLSADEAAAIKNARRTRQPRRSMIGELQMSIEDTLRGENVPTPEDDAADPPLHDRPDRRGKNAPMPENDSAEAAGLFPDAAAPLSWTEEKTPNAAEAGMDAVSGPASSGEDKKMTAGWTERGGAGGKERLGGAGRNQGE